MTESHTKLKLPQIQNVKLNSFSLYSVNPDAEFACDKGVVCLVGANGIGKTTLLSAINFCLTGIVSDPNRSFESMDEFVTHNRKFSASYFRGRISGGDEDDAEITVCFRLGKIIYEIRRGMFESEELRGLTISDFDSGMEIINTDSMGRIDRHQAYTTQFIKDCGVSSFSEFVFLQHFVFTFDEQHRTLFWNKKILERVLYKAFGLDTGMAKHVDTIKREIQKVDSQVRNRQWDLTKLRNRINKMLEGSQNIAGTQEKYDELSGEHENLSHQFEEVSNELADFENDIKDNNLVLANLSATEMALRDEYAKLFDKIFSGGAPLNNHPLIMQSLEEHACGICGNNSEGAIGIILLKKEGDCCPLCDSQVSINASHEGDPKKLQALDQKISEKKQKIRDVLVVIEKLRNEEGVIREQWKICKTKLNDFDHKNTETMAALRELLKDGVDNASLSGFQAQLANIENEKQEALNSRESLKSQLLTCRRDLEQQYRAVENEFVPKFRELAHLFLGMPLDVVLDTKADVTHLVVEVRGTTRRHQQNLSESQRFFLDIALRMALIQQMSDSQAQGGIYIDTPEGSLDIAYEKRAGDMLAKFAKSGHQVVMTANLNSSQLLRALARTCGRQGMQIYKMTEWAELSEVQQDEEALFREAFQEIEMEMDKVA